MPASEPSRMARLKPTITPARRSPPKRTSASDAVAMGQLFYATSILLLAAHGSVRLGLGAGSGTRLGRPLRPRLRMRLRPRRVVRPASLGPAAHLAALGVGRGTLAIVFPAAQRPEHGPHDLAVRALARRRHPPLLHPWTGGGTSRGSRAHVGRVRALRRRR